MLRKKSEKSKSTRFLKLWFNMFYNPLFGKISKNIEEIGIDLDGDTCIAISRFTKKPVGISINIIKHTYKILPRHLVGEIYRRGDNVHRF